MFFMCLLNPKISVLLTAYNNPNVERAIESVLNQTYKNWELIILDDNSDKPEVLEIYKRYQDHPQIKFYNSQISKEDRWKECPYARNINVGLKMATGALITYLCDDAEYLPQRFEKMVKFLRRHPWAKVCYGRQLVQIETGDGIQWDIILKPDRILRDPTRKVDHNSVMHYKSCIKKVGYWITTPPVDTPYTRRELYRAGDAWFWRKLGAVYPFYPICEVLDIHHHTADSFSEKVVFKYSDNL